MRTNTRKFRLALTSLAVVALLLSVSGAMPVSANGPTKVWVDATNGNDDNPGTQAAPFATIQKGIDTVAPDGTVHVAAGPYNENVDVDKSVTIQSENGASGTIVNGSADKHTFNVTKDGVNISGFTVEGATADKKAGIYLDQVESCNISANTCSDNYYGIYLDNSITNTLTSNIAISNTKDGIYLDGSHGNTLNGNTARQNGECGIYVDNSNNNTLTENTVTGNDVYGINLDGSDNNTLTGNSVTANNIGVKIQGSVDAATISMNFNSIHSNTDYGVENSGAGTADATNNWWGANDGPSASPGSGDKISGNVNADPWLMLNISASPMSLVADGSSNSTITADMTKNSDGQDTSGTGTIREGTEITFTTNAGSIGSTTVTKGTTDGKATATLTSSTTVETADVTASAPPGAAPATVSAAVFFTAPGVSVEDSKTEETDPGTDTVDAKDEADIHVTKEGDGTPTVTCAEYSSNPQAGFTNDVGKYYDVHIDSDTDVDSLTIEFYFTDAEIERRDTSTLRAKYWASDSWENCSNQTLHLGAVNGYAGYIEVTITATSSPSLDDLMGEEFGLEGDPPPPPDPVAIGGYIVPVSRLELLAPWIGLASLMAMAVAAVVVRRRKV